MCVCVCVCVCVHAYVSVCLSVCFGVCLFVCFCCWCCCFLRKTRFCMYVFFFWSNCSIFSSLSHNLLKTSFFIVHVYKFVDTRLTKQQLEKGRKQYYTLRVIHHIMTFLIHRKSVLLTEADGIHHTIHISCHRHRTINRHWSGFVQISPGVAYAHFCTYYMGIIPHIFRTYKLKTCDKSNKDIYHHMLV